MSTLKSTNVIFVFVFFQFSNRNAKKSGNSKVISASKCAEAMEKAVSAKDIEDATRRLLEFENEVVINREKTLKSRKRKKHVEDEDILQMEEGNAVFWRTEYMQYKLVTGFYFSLLWEFKQILAFIMYA